MWYRRAAGAVGGRRGWAGAGRCCRWLRRLGLGADQHPHTLPAPSHQVVAEMMDTIRRHQVPLKGVISTVVISTVVLEGWSTKLDPDIRIMESLKEVGGCWRRAWGWCGAGCGPVRGICAGHALEWGVLEAIGRCGVCMLLLD